ncbi:MAG: hypothetical protein RR292_05065, partial [Christensenellaceae bacterium]
MFLNKSEAVNSYDAMNVVKTSVGILSKRTNSDYLDTCSTSGKRETCGLHSCHLKHTRLEPMRLKQSLFV